MSVTAKGRVSHNDGETAQREGTPIHRKRYIAVRTDRFELSIQENSTKRDRTELKKKNQKNKIKYDRFIRSLLSFSPFYDSPLCTILHEKPFRTDVYLKTMKRPRNKCEKKKKWKGTCTGRRSERLEWVSFATYRIAITTFRRQMVEHKCKWKHFCWAFN